MRALFIATMAVLACWVAGIAAADAKPVRYERIRAICHTPISVIQYEIGKNNVINIVVKEHGVEIAINKDGKLVLIHQVNIPCTVVKESKR